MKVAHAACVVLLCALTGCAGHDAKTLAARNALDAGDPRGALQALNEELEVSSEKDLPEKTGGDNALLLLDRAMVLQELEKYPLSSRDLESSDKQIEVLDLSANAGADIGRYLFSDDVGPYKAPAYEKLMINTMNMMNYLARSDLNGARVEARRLAVMQKFTRDSGDAAQALLGPGSYLAGFVFEKSGKPDDALRYYDEALAYGQYQSLAEPIRRLTQQSGYSSPRIKELLAKSPPGPGAAPAGADAPRDDDAELLVMVNFGRVPAKVARRIPIGLALTYASGFISPMDQVQANKLAAQGLVTWINYPELGQPRGTYGRPTFMLDGQWGRLEGIVAVDQEAKRAWDKARGAIIASAITRLITRVVTGETAKKVAGGGLFGELLSLGTQATLTATDTPDTRNWSTLPARIAFGRVRIHAGTHVVTLSAAGGHKRQSITVAPNGWAVVNLTALN
jgi:tetratricopeptide (TPR) repeat protein